MPTVKYKGTPKKGRSREFRETHSGEPERALWDEFPWRMRMAKVNVLGHCIVILILLNAEKFQKERNLFVGH